MNMGLLLTGRSGKVVGLVVSHICLWKRDERNNIFSSQGGQFPRGSCMWMHDGPVTCSSFSDEHLLIDGSSFGRIYLSDLSSDQQVGTLKTNDSAVVWVNVKEYEALRPDKIAVDGGEQNLKELNGIFSKALKELLLMETEVDDAALIWIDSKGTYVRVR